MRDALDEAEIGTPRPPLVANVTAGAVKDPEEIRRRLVEQVTGTVRWRESVGFMAGGGGHPFAGLGPGQVLAGLVKRRAAGAGGGSARAPQGVGALAPA